MKADLYLSNALVVTETRRFHGGVLVKNGKITALVEGDAAFPAEETLDLAGKILMPGIVDSHMHFNEPGRSEWEGFTSGSYAASASGITTVFDMPFNSLPVTLDVKSLHQKKDAIKDQSIVDYGLWGLVGNSTLNELAPLYHEGVVGFKGFMPDPGEFDSITSFKLYEAMELVAKLGGIICLHAESEALIQGLTERVKKEGRKDPQAWLDSHPPFVELEALQQAVLYAIVTGCRVHIAHVTLPEGFEIINWGRSKGAKVTGETCPHYLLLDEKDFLNIGPAAKCSPPIRSRAAVEGLWKHLFAGDIELLCSDHSPTTPEKKNLGGNDIWTVWGGMSAIQMMLPVLFTEGVHKRGLPLETLVRLTSFNPAHYYGIAPEKGVMAPGADADFMVVDPEAEWTFSSDMILSKNKISPYIGRKFKGMVKRTILRGQTIYADGEVKAKPGYGRFVKRQPE